jgi:hypothetical protein
LLPFPAWETGNLSVFLCTPPLSIPYHVVLKKKKSLLKYTQEKPALVAHAWIPSYRLDQEDFCLRPARANSSQDPISKIARAK